ncbi:MAG: hypothetical protein ACP5OG_00480 [Candidatus Nanoarchaeia archaeon]
MEKINLKKYLCIFSIIGFFLFALSFVSAYQEKMTVKSCEYSFNDLNFGSWIDTEQKGVFMKIENTNLNLGATENAEYINTTDDKFKIPYYNNFGSGGTSDIPIINVDYSKDNIIYIKCKYKVGEYQVLINKDYYALYSSIYLTHDFDITTGLVSNGPNPPKTENYNYYKDSILTDLIKNYSYYSYPLMTFQDNTIERFYNGYDTYTGQEASNMLYSRGFYPNTEPEVVSKVDLKAKNVTSGFVIFDSRVNENSAQPLFTPSFKGYMYIKSTLNNAAHFIKPRFIDVTSNQIKVIGPDATISAIGNGCTKDCALVKNSSVIDITLSAKNDFMVPLDNTNISVLIYSPISMGVASKPAPTLDVQMPYFLESYLINLAPIAQESVNFKKNISSIPGFKSMIFPQLYASLVTKRAGSTTTQSFRIGGDDVDYLGFGRIDPKIQMIEYEGKILPGFNLNVQLYVLNNFYGAQSINPRDYYILIEVYNNSLQTGTTKARIERPLEISLNEEVLMDYSEDIPINEDMKEEMKKGANYTVAIFSRKKTGDFTSKKIATNTVIPYFVPGDLAYVDGNTFVFNPSSKVDSKIISLFNPNPQPIKITLKPTDLSDPSNFLVGYDGEHFYSWNNDNSKKEVILQPFEDEKVQFYVNAVYYPDWVTEDKKENLKLELSTDLGGKKMNMNFDLIVDKEIRNYFDFHTPVVENQLYVDPCKDSSTSEYGSSNGTQSLNISWKVKGLFTNGNILYNGQKYKVNIKILKETNGELVKEETKEYTIGSDSVSSINYEYLESTLISHDFKNGKYIAIVELDSENKISELNKDRLDTYNPEINNIEIDFKVLLNGCAINTQSDSNNLIYYLGSPINDALFANPMPGCDKCGYCCSGLSLKCVTNNGGYTFCSSDLPGGNEKTCSKKGSPDECLAAGLFCLWNFSGDGVYKTSPPDVDNSPGKCLGCSEIMESNTCGIYNNRYTCQKDPCGKAENEKNYICNLLVGDKPDFCNVGSVPGCYWDSSDNKCKISFGYCVWDVGIDDCSPKDPYKKKVVTYTPKGVQYSGTTLPCTQGGFTVYADCPGSELGFFDYYNLVYSLIILVLGYYFYSRKALKTHSKA